MNEVKVSVNTMYEKGSEWFGHIIAVRRNSLAFVFLISGATLGFLVEKLGKGENNNQVILLFIFNLVIIVTLGILHDYSLRKYQRRISAFLVSKEEDGLFTNTRPSNFLEKGSFGILMGYITLSIGWIVILVFHFCQL